MSYIKNCKICQWIKTPTLKLAGMLQPLEILDMNWEVVNMDFIYGLSPSTHGYMPSTCVWISCPKWATLCQPQHTLL